MGNHPSKAANRNDVGMNEGKQSSALPSTLRFCMESGQAVIPFLKAVAPLVPGPAGLVLGVVLALLDACEQVTALKERINALKGRLSALGVILAASMEGGNQDMTDEKVEKLRVVLESIGTKLQTIRDQSRIRLCFFAGENKGLVDDCVTQINEALEEFHLEHAITTEEALNCIIRDLKEGFQKVQHSLEENRRQMNGGFMEMKALIQNQPTPNASTFTSSGMPARLNQDHFRGRSGMTEGLGNILCSNGTKQHIAILATGGMGKTTVAVEVMESDIVKDTFGGNRFWVSCTGATSFALFLQVLVASLRIKTDSGDLQADIQSGLTASDAPRLIVLDNFETPWDTSEKNDVERVLCSLASIHHVAIVLTMRSNYPPSKQTIDWHVEDLKPLDLDASRQIYTDINPSAKDHKSLDNLLTALGYMPFAVKLIATLGEESDSPPNVLLEIWNERGTRTVGDEIDRSISLSVDSALLRSHPEAVSLLIILSMLPAGATRGHIDWWALRLGSDVPLAISILNRTALISKLEGPSDSPTYFVYPVVQSYMEHSGRILPKDRVDLQEAAFKFILYCKQVLLKALASEDINLQGILTFAVQQRMQKNAQPDEISDAKLFDALRIFTYYQLQSKPTLEIATLAVKFARSLHRKADLANGLYCLGEMQYQLSDYDGASNAYREARALFMSLGHPSPSAEVAFRLMSSYHLTNNMSAADSLEEELRACSKVLNADDQCQLIAITQQTIAMNLIQKGCHEEALVCLSDALKYFDHTGHSSDRALCLHMLCACYDSLGQYRESMEAAQLAEKESEYPGLDANGNSVRELECNLELLLQLEDYDQALQVSETYLQESRRLVDFLGTARALEFRAQVFEQRGDVAAVRLDYESALEQYKIIESSAEGQMGIQRCEYNLELLAQAMAEDEDDEGDIVSGERRVMPRLDHVTLFRSDVSSIHSSDTNSGVAEST